MPISRLRAKEKCPIHQSYFCCGRESRKKTQASPSNGWKSKAVYVSAGVWRVPDEYHARGYRERRNVEGMRILLRQKVAEQDRKCALCGLPFDDYRQIVADHKEPRGMGGARRDDHPDNIQAAHNWPCNMEKGSKRIA